MLIYIGIDDTDTIDADRGTGRLARGLAAALPEGCRARGVVRQQLPRLPGIPFTSNNSSACVVVEAGGEEVTEELMAAATAHLAADFIPGSDPGLCVMAEDSRAVPALLAFGRTCCGRIVTQAEAMAAAAGAHLSAHGGTGDGIIGAAAGVGLTLSGWSGRFVEYGDLRAYPVRVPVRDLEAAGIRVLSVDRDALVPGPEDVVDTGGWLRPRLWAGGPVLPVRQSAAGAWVADGGGGRQREREG
ncbi:MAG: hypothetical protein ABIL09_01910 [Gemmatimonadota bacterium]